jgi:hypothetical protein
MIRASKWFWQSLQMYSKMGIVNCDSPLTKTQNLRLSLHEIIRARAKIQQRRNQAANVRER